MNKIKPSRLTPLIMKKINSWKYKRFEKCSANAFPCDRFALARDCIANFAPNNLAIALEIAGIDAFIVEPGYTFQYYANVSQTDWEVWEPEERPFLMIIAPQFDTILNQVVAKTSFLAPHFEEGRVRMLGMLFEEDLSIVTREEHWNPYRTLSKNWNEAICTENSAPSQVPEVMVDEEMRDFIQRGLGENDFEVIGLAGNVKRVKQTTTVGEVDILRAVDTGTAEASRAMWKCMVPGLNENEVMNGFDMTTRAGDENAAMPHGGRDGSKVLGTETLVLFDVGAHLYGYSSDICRTFFPPFFSDPTDDSLLSPLTKRKIAVWDIVFEAQIKALNALKSNSSCASVDIAARDFITDAGCGKAFTHRVGHGIGIKAHESPFLNKGNFDDNLNAGMAFTLEPGVYLEGRFGVRHEDVFLVNGDGEADILTGSRAKGPWNP